MTAPDAEGARALIFEISENQIRDGTPLETKQTYDRLIADGHSHEETMKLIACVVTTEIFHVMKENRPFNQQRYVSALLALPKLPWECGD